MVDTRRREYNPPRSPSVASKQQQFTKEFRESAVRLVVDQGRTVSDVAASLGIKVDVLKWWVRSSKKSGEKAQAVEETALRRRVRELEAENRRLLMEREILKKAAAYFARDQP
jgi:transposase